MAVASEIPHRRAAALRPSPLRISAASAASREGQVKTAAQVHLPPSPVAILVGYRDNGDRTAKADPRNIREPRVGSKRCDRHMERRSGEIARHFEFTARTANPTDLRAHEATNFCNASGLPATAGRNARPQKYSVAGVEHRFRYGIREYDFPRRIGQNSTLWQHLDSLRRGEIREVQFPKLAIYPHGPAEVPRNGLEETQLLFGQVILVGCVGYADQGGKLIFGHQTGACRRETILGRSPPLVDTGVAAEDSSRGMRLSRV